MQQFTVPQFIDVENKIIGPITSRQFIIMLGAAIVSAITYRLASFNMFVILTLFYLGLSGVFAFLKVNGQAFHYFVLNFIQTLKKPKLRVWNNQLSKTKQELQDKEVQEVTKAKIVPKKPVYAKSRLAELSLIADTGGAYGGGDKDIQINA